MLPERQLAETLTRNLEDRVTDRRLHRRAAIVAHADEPMRGRKEAHVYLWRILRDARQMEPIEIVLDNASILDIAGLVHGIVVEPRDLALDLLLDGQRVDETEPRLVRNVDARAIRRRRFRVVVDGCNSAGALLLPEKGRWKEKHGSQKRAVLGMKFRTFLNAFMHVPVQVIRTGRRIVYRLLAWNQWLEVLLRGVDALRLPLRC